MLDDAILLKRKHARLAIVAPLVIAVIAELALVAAVVLVAWSGDRDLADLQRRTLASYLDQILRLEAQSTLDYAVWNDLVDNLGPSPKDPGFLDGRFLLNIHTYGSAETAAVLDAGGTPVWVSHDDERADAAWYADHCPRCDALAAAVRDRAARPDSAFRTLALTQPYAERPDLPADFPVAVEFAESDGHPVVVVAAPIARENPAERGSGPYPVLVTVVPFSETYMKDIRTDTGIASARLASPDEPGVPLRAGADGRVLAVVAFDRSTPAMDLVLRFAPLGLAFLALFTGLVVALVRWLHRTTVNQVAGEALGAHHATHDPLTGLGNRSYLAAELDLALGAAQEARVPAARLLIDLDGFKGINDTHGHGAGDELIRQFADRLVRGLPAECRIARLGGDEFAVLVPTVDDEAALDALAGKVLALARTPFDLDGIEGRIGCSVGVALAPDQALDRGEWMRKADVALYRAKGDGRNRARRFAPALDQRVRERRSAEDGLRAALADADRFSVRYRPVCALAADPPVPVAYRADLGWHDPGGRVVSARAMTRAAEETGLSAELGTVLLRKVAADAPRWPGHAIIVAAAPTEVCDPTFADRILMILDEADLPPHRLEIALTDGLRHATSRESLRQLFRLRGAGVTISLDGFGAGFANLTQLRALPLDRITIAGTLVRGIAASAEQRHILTAVVDLARSLGLQVGVDGVDEAEQLAVLKAAGCHRAAGAALAAAEDDDSGASALPAAAA